jgi:hypothetical protein
MKLQIYKVGLNWILWIPGVRVYRFSTWQSAIEFAMKPGSSLAQNNIAASAAAS